MAVTFENRMPSKQVHQVAADWASGHGAVDFGAKHFSVSGQMPKQTNEVEVSTPGQISAGAKGQLTVMSTHGHLGLQATGKGSSIDFMKMG